MLLGQPEQALLHGGDRRCVEGGILRPGTCVGLRTQPDPLLQHIVEGAGGAPAPAAIQVAGLVYRDAEQPRLERTALEGMNGAPRGNERLLGDILRELAIRDVAQHEVVQRPLVTLDKRIEAAQIPGLRLPDELLVARLDHARSRIAAATQGTGSIGENIVTPIELRLYTAHHRATGKPAGKALPPKPIRPG